MERGKLELKLLGPPEARRDGAPLRLRTKKALALLAYLAAEGGTRRRAELAALLWPESDEKRARTTLRSALADLRSALGSGNGTEDEYLLIDRDSLGLGTKAGADLDLTVLQTAYELARNLTSVARSDGGQRRELMERLQEGLEAYRGEFLEGFYLDDAPEFDSWASLEREGWRRRAEAVFDRLSQLELGAGEVGEAIATAERWTRHARTSEAAHLRLMEASFAAGDGAAALRAFEACRQILGEELGVGPSPETEALAARIRAEAPSPSSARHARSPTSGATRSVRGRLEVPFVGRSEPFGTLIEEYHSARGRSSSRARPASARLALSRSSSAGPSPRGRTSSGGPPSRPRKVYPTGPWWSP